MNYEYLFMSFYIYQLVEPLFLANTSISLLAISHQSSAINYQLSVINYPLSAIFTKQSLTKLLTETHSHIFLPFQYIHKR